MIDWNAVRPELKGAIEETCLYARREGIEVVELIALIADSYHTLVEIDPDQSK